MVNVGGRSKGCSTCRRRRIKCDETSPICKRCARHGLQCSGPQTTTFIINTIGNSRRIAGRPTRKLTPSTESRALVADHAPQTTPFLKHNDREVYICFVRQRLLPDGPLDAALSNTTLNDIMAVGQVSGSGGPIFDATVLSFATILFGAEHNEPSILARGYATYDIALGRLNQALSDAERCTGDDVIVSVIALVILECLVPTSPKSYLNQMLGLERLVDLRYQTSSRVSNERSLYLYRCVRPLIVFASLRSATPSIFARPDWKQFFQMHSSPVTMQAENLWELLADCTVLVSKCNCRSVCETQGCEQNDLLSRALALQSALHSWKKTWDITHENDFAVFYAADAKDFDYGLGVFNTSTVITPLVYYTTLIHLNIVLASLTGAQLGTNHDLEAGRQAALRIVQCLPNYLNIRDSSQRYALPVVQWAAVTAFHMLGGRKTIEGKNLMQMLHVANASPTQIAPGIWED